MWPSSSSIGTVSTNWSVPCSRTTSVSASSGARNSQNSVMPPACRKRSVVTSASPGVHRLQGQSGDEEAGLPRPVVQVGQRQLSLLQEDLPIRPVADAGAADPPLDPSDLAQRVVGGEFGRRSGAVEGAGHPAPERHRPGGAVPVDLDVEPGGEGVDHRAADAVQTTGGVVGAGTELAARVQLGEHDLDPGEAGARLLVDRDAPAVVGDRDAAVAVQRDQDLTTESAQRLVDGIVDDLPQAVHETAGVGRPDVHRRALADGLQTLQD